MRVSSKQIRQAILVTEGTVQDNPLPEYFAFFKDDGTQITLESIVGPVGPRGINWRGEYDPEKDYEAQDAVFYNGKGYITMKPVAAGGALPDVLFGPFPGTTIPTVPLSAGTTPGSLTPDDYDEAGRYIDYYRFTVAFGGTLSISIRADPRFDSEVWLYNGAGEEIGHNDDLSFPGGAGFDSRINATLGPGTYFVRAGSHTVVHSTGDYNLDLTLGTAVLGEDGATWDMFVEGGTGEVGPAGLGVPPGGLPNQVLAKVTAEDNDTHWVDQSAGGGGAEPPLFSDMFSGDLSAYSVLSGSFAIDGSGRLGPGSANAQNIIVRDDVVVSNAVQVIKVIPGASTQNGETSMIFREQPNGDRIEADVRIDTATTALCEIWVVQGGSYTSKNTRNSGINVEERVSPGLPYWVVGRCAHDHIISEYWVTDPAYGGVPAVRLVHRLSGSDKAAFGAGVEGKFGLRCFLASGAATDIRWDYWKAFPGGDIR